MMNIKILRNRLYGDYIMPTRLAHYERLIADIIEAGYKHVSVRDAWRAFNSDTKLNRILVHRHDVDTDVKTARKFFEIERKLGVFSTFYFRLSTLDVKLMRDIEEYGGEASYHYEELASYAKENHIKSPEIILNNLSLIQEEFLKNLSVIRKKTGLSCLTVASHGDFANRKLGLANHIILQDLNFRKKCGVIHESYDFDFMKIFNCRMSDNSPPDFWSPVSPYEALMNKVDNIFLLTHPRHWKSSIVANTRENFLRLYEGISW